MSTPNNMFATISNDELATATGGVTADVSKHQIYELKHTLSDISNSQQNNNQNQQQGLMLGMVMALALRNRS